MLLMEASERIAAMTASVSPRVGFDCYPLDATLTGSAGREIASL